MFIEVTESHSNDVRLVNVEHVLAVGVDDDKVNIVMVGDNVMIVEETYEQVRDAIDTCKTITNAAEMGG